MKKNRIFRVLLCGALLGLLVGCGESAPTDELVENGKEADMQSAGGDIEAGSSYVNVERKTLSTIDFESAEADKGYQNEKPQQTSRTFPTLAELKENVKEELGERYWPEVSLSEAELKSMTGITEDMYVEFLAEEQILDTNIDMMMIIHSKEEYVGAIEKALEKYREYVIEENVKYPQNYGKAMASRMETIENYICFVQLGADTSIVANKGEEGIIAYCQEENERAIDVIEKMILR